MFSEYLKKVIKKEDLQFEEAIDAMDNIMTGKVDEIHLTSFLTALKMKGESIDEIAGFARAMIENAERFDKGVGREGRRTSNLYSTSELFGLK